MLGLEALGIRGAVVGHIEREACAASALVAGMENKGVGRVPVWDDLATFDGRRWRGCVDLFVAGLPCPAYSLAGAGLGNVDPRAWGDPLKGREPVWELTKDGDRDCLELYQRHYSAYRYADGRERKLFVGPGEKIVLRTPDGDACFVWRRFIDDSGQRGVNCAFFRNESAHLSSELIRQADAVADCVWPGERHYTYVDSTAIRSINPGFCFKRAGWRDCGRTKGGLHILEREPGDGWGPVAHALRIISECRPAVVFFENVPNWVVGGHFRPVGEELCRLGYEVEAPLFLAAEDVKAPHQRERVFVLAVVDAELRRWREHATERGAEERAAAGRGGAKLANRDGNGRGAAGSAGQPGIGCDVEPCGSGVATPAGVGLADACGTGREGPERSGALQEQGPAARGSTAERGGELGDTERGEPGPGDPREQGQARGRGNRPSDPGDRLPLYPPGQDDWPAWTAVADLDPSRMPRVEPEVSVVADGLAPARSDLLRLGGNGVVPVAAAVAFAHLFTAALDRIGGDG